MTLRLGYGLNGFTDHRLEDALAVLSGMGYDGVALTLDHAHLDPFPPGLHRRVAHVAALLEQHGLDVVVETGARYLLDPLRKHEPTPVSAEGRERRVTLLTLALQVAADLGAPAVSFWSGVLPTADRPSVGWSRLRDTVEQLLPRATALGIDLAIEPEPGMLVDTVERALRLRSSLGDPDRLRLTLDIGHLWCNEELPPEECVRLAGPHLRHVQIDDMRRGVHEHLPFGEGEVDFPPVLAALAGLGYDGLVSVELPRHTYAAPTLAAQSLAFLREAITLSEHQEAAR